LFAKVLGHSNTRSWRFAAQTPVVKGTTINLVTRIENTIQFPFIVSQQDHNAGLTLPGNQAGVRIFTEQECYDNAARGGVKECPRVLQWKSRCGGGQSGSGSSSEDVQKYECLDAAVSLGCEYSGRVCRYIHFVAVPFDGRVFVDSGSRVVLLLLYLSLLLLRVLRQYCPELMH